MAVNTLSKNINQAVSDFHAIKDKIVEKGLKIPENTPTSGYADLIGYMDYDTKNWNNVDFSKGIPTGAKGLDSVYEHSNGIDVYFYTINNFPDAQGLWHMNKQEKIIRRIYSTGYYWSTFFETSNGTLYVSGKVSAAQGILCVKGNTATLIYDSGNYWVNVVEDTVGNIYCASTLSTQLGILKLTETAGTQIFAEGYAWKFIAGINGYVYSGADNTSSLGVLSLKDDVVTRIYTETRNWINMYAAKNGDVYMSSNLSGTNGLLYLKNGTATKIYSSTPHWRYFYENKDGYVYMATSSANTGILSVRNGIATKIISTGDDYQYYYERENGEIYVTSSDVSTMVYIKNNIAYAVSNISTSGYFRYFFETSNGDIYLGNSSTGLNYGLNYLKDGVGEKIFTEGSAWRAFYESENGDVYVGTTNSSSISYGCGILKLDGNTAMQIHNTGFYWYYHIEKDGYVYFMTKASADKNNYIVRVSGSNAEEIFLKI